MPAVSVAWVLPWQVSDQLIYSDNEVIPLGELVILALVRHSVFHLSFGIVRFQSA